MDVSLSATEQAALAAAAAGERRVRHWRRYRAILLLAEGRAARAVAAALGCSENSVSNWSRAWKHAGPAGLAEPPHGGRVRALGTPAEAHLSRLLAADPQTSGHHAAGWTVPLLRTELASAGSPVSEHTVRRTLHRLGWRWKRPTYLLGRPDPAYAEKKRR
jgi:transposase